MRTAAYWNRCVLNELCDPCEASDTTQAGFLRAKLRLGRVRLSPVPGTGPVLGNLTMAWTAGNVDNAMTAATLESMITAGPGLVNSNRVVDRIKDAVDLAMGVLGLSQADGGCQP